MHYDSIWEKIQNETEAAAKKRIEELISKMSYDEIMYLQKVAINIKEYIGFEMFLEKLKRD